METSLFDRSIHGAACVHARAGGRTVHFGSVAYWSASKVQCSTPTCWMIPQGPVDGQRLRRHAAMQSHPWPIPSSQNRNPHPSHLGQLLQRHGLVRLEAVLLPLVRVRVVHVPRLHRHGLLLLFEVLLCLSCVMAMECVGGDSCEDSRGSEWLMDGHASSARSPDARLRSGCDARARVGVAACQDHRSNARGAAAAANIIIARAASESSSRPTRVGPTTLLASVSVDSSDEVRLRRPIARRGMLASASPLVVPQF